tara:strand:- start:6074 stop:6619 length:546 start_codon:yes stop_codon:yes gene_type:complete
MDTTNIERYLNSFGQNVVDDSKKLLQSEKGSTALGKSIRFKVTKEANGFSTKFYMDDYGTFLDKGVSGNKKKQSYKDSKGRTVSSPYAYTTKGPPIDIISKWIKKKGIKGHGIKKGRSKDTGQYVSGFAYLISRKIKRDGIKSLAFFQKPLGFWYDRLQDDFLKIFKQDIKSYLTTFTKHK